MSESLGVPNGVSIIIPTYNEPPNVIRGLSGLAQTAGVAEVIIVDSSDNDDCRLAISSFAQQENVIALSSQVKGRGQQMNIGAQQTRGVILLFLHADTQLPDAAIETVMNAREAGYHWGRFDVRLNDQRLPFRVIEWLMNKRSAITHIATGDQAIFMTREAYDIVDGFDQIELMEDVAMSKKLRRLGPICAVPLPVVTSARRWQQNGIGNTILTMWWLRFRYYVGASPKELALSYQQGGLVQQTTDRPISVFVFAKAPVAGQVKSRLCPPLDSTQAAQIADILLQRVCAELAASWPGKTCLAITPDDSHPSFQTLLRQYDFATILQDGDDLGERMWNAIEQGLQTSSMAAVVGADIPEISGAVLQQAYALMSVGKSVVGPTHDGGFYFLGVPKVSKDLFHRIEWGSHTVFARLLNNASALGIKLHRLPKLDDCDYWEDVQSTAKKSATFKASLLAAGISIGLIETDQQSV